MSGVIRDGDGDTPLSQVTVSLLRSMRGGGRYEPLTVSDAAGRYSVQVTTPFLPALFTRSRFVATSRNIELSGDATLNLTLPRECSVRPGGLTATVSRDAVQFSWSAVSGATDYLLEVGTAAPRSDSPYWFPADIISTRTGATTSYRWDTPRGGTFFARVASRTSCGLSAPSEDVRFTT